MSGGKEYQSNRNKYTKQSWPAVGVGRPSCEEHWWDPRGRCVMCGQPQLTRPIILVQDDRPLPPNPSHALTANDLELRNKRRQ